MTLIERLKSYAADAFGLAAPEVADPAEDEALAAIALLVHVARADGTLAAPEAERLARLVEGRYARSRPEADALIARATAFDAETRDMAELVERMGHDADRPERLRLLAMAWSVASADGAVHEFEEALVWRLGGLLGLGEDEIGRARTGPAAIA
ncbi:Tellurite resistance protein TerB [Methylobacterium sp. Leaf399]|uniref:tellurite resistance TerB family protein n=2 Tax=unclassified Methylobacterium TaxID=2615210 RepID=UPI0006F790C0|nr:TerB family tellurite resistance protein [Methylobacterium sp. Leaf399]KQT09888.1 Tellurite resistance protein TerB [Methylobacterium sp. Leaf399]